MQHDSPVSGPGVDRSTPAGRIDDSVRTLTPGCFALVMATGIVSIAADAHGWGAVSAGLAWIGAVAWVVLVALTVARLVRHRDAMVADLRHPGRAFGFFTFVAATCVMGSRVTSEAWHILALALLVTGAVVWLALGYVIPWTAVLARRPGPILQAADGSWFVWVVASQSVAVLAASLESDMTGARDALATLAVFSWSIGVFLYVAVGLFVAARMLMFDLRAIDLTPSYWVAMGATAITVVAGSRIVQMADAPMVDATRELIAGASVFFWIFGTWLIPPLVGAGIWRHVVHRVPLTYEAGLWSVVFPLGMYGVGSSFLGEANDLPLLVTIGSIEAWVAIAAWTVTFAAMLIHLTRTVARP